MIEIKKRDNIWILKVDEEFAFNEDEFKMMEAQFGVILEMKTTQEIIEDLGISLTKHNTDKMRDFTKKWFSEEEIKEIIDGWKTGLRLKNSGFTKDEILFGAHIIIDFKDYLFEKLDGGEK